MGTTTFTGPIKAGDILNTSGTTVGSDVANVGYVVMAQTSAVTQASSATTIVIPAGSQILEIDLNVITAWNGAASTLGVGTTVSATALTAAAAVDGATIGIVAAVPGADATRAGNWVNVGTTDVKIVVTSTNTGDGDGWLTVRYVQAIANA
jgi:hypothetical protein